MKKYALVFALLISPFLFSQNYYHDTQGKLEISSSGSATYMLPVAMPPSIQDVGPVINLVYNSGQIGGIAGQGWSINSISTISRIATRKDIDGFIDGVDFDSNDKLALDGQRLLLKTGTYFASGSTYETETFSNSKIQLMGSGTSMYFIVTAPDGSRSWYGNYGGMNAVDLSSYYITRFEDANGNYFTYHYTKPLQKSLCISEIRFSANTVSSIAPQNSIKFNYATAKRTESGYLKGVKVEKVELLKNIEVRTNGLLFRKYVLTHDLDTQLGYERIVKLQEFNGNNEPANPVIFEYETTIMEDAGSETISNYTNNLDFNDIKLSGDFDGDSRLDFIADNSLYANLFNGTSNSKTAELPTTVVNKYTITTLSNNKLNQFNSVLSVENGSLNQINYKIYNLHTNTFVNDYTKAIPAYGQFTTGFSTVYNIIGDFNGDGISEVLFRQDVTQNPCFPDPNNTFNFPCESVLNTRICLLDLNPNSSVVSGSQGLANLNNISALFSFYNKNIVMDFNGDGKDDILSIHNPITINDTTDKSYKIFSFKQLTTSPWVELEVIGSGVLSDYTKEKQLLFGDFNGDGKTDLMLPDTEGGSNHIKWHIYYSNPNPAGGAFFVKETHDIVEYWPDTGTAFSTQKHFSNYYAIDTNGDGKSDLVRVWRKHYKDQGPFEWNDHNTQWIVTSYVNNIGNTQAASKFQLDYQSPCQLGPFGNNCNHNSDSPGLIVPIVSNYSHAGVKQDLVIVHNHYNRVFYIKFKKDVAEDIRLKKVISSGGNIVDMIAYTDLEPTNNGTNGLGLLSDFYSSGDAVSYPFVELKRIPSAKVVSALVNITEGVTKLQGFKYHGLVVNMDGLGAMGFRKTARSAWVKVASGSGTVKAIWDVQENNFLWRGANQRSYSQLVNDSNAFTFVTSGTPAGIISSTVNTFESTILPNKVYKISLSSQTTNDYLSDFKYIKDYAYSEPYLLPETIITRNYFRISRASILQGTYTTINEFENNPTGTGNNYYIGRLKKTTSKSAAYMGAIEIVDEKYTYTGNKLTKTEKRPNDTGYFLTEEFEYFPNGNLKKKTLSAPGSIPWTAARTTEYTYDPSERYIKTVKDVEGLITTYNTYHPLYGVVLIETNPFAQTTTSVYDNWGKRTKITDYLGKSVNYSYSKTGHAYTTHEISDDGSESKVVNDALGRIVLKGSKNISGNWSFTKTEFDFLGRKTRSSEPYFEGGSPSQWNTIEYDDYSRVKQTVAYTGLTTTISYSSGLLETGAKVTVDDGTKVTSTTKNSNGHTISATDPGGTITYTYYSNGNLKTSTFDGTTVTMEYDLWGRKSKLIDPSAGTYTYQYYPFGEVFKEITPKGTTQYEYTPSGKIEMKSISGDLTNQNIFYSYNSSKQLSTIDGYDVEGNSFYVQYVYDTNKRLIKTIENNPESTFEKEMVYDDFGRVNKELYKAIDNASGKSSSKWIRNTYLQGYHWQILDDTTNAMLWQIDEVNERGQLVTAHYGNAVGRVTNTYSSYGMPSTMNYRTINGTYASPSSFLSLLTSINPQNGLLNSRRNFMFNIQESFQYDSQERLTHFPNAAGQIEQQQYDNKGRITQNSVGSYDYGNTQKAYQATKITLSPDASTYYNERPLQQIAYNAFKSPVSISEQGKEKINFAYNLFQTRTTMFYGNEETDKNLRPLRKYYSADGVMEIKRNISTGAVDFTTYIGGDGYSAPVIVKSDGTSQNYFYLHRDYLGSIMAITNAAGQVVEKRHFDAWGNIVKLQNGSGVNLTEFAIIDRGYTGHEHLLKVGLINMNGRLYDPKVHRFLAPDNYIQDPTNTQNFNRYGYVLNNPLKYTDPSGEEFISFGLAVGIGAFIAATTYSIQAGYTYGFQASGWGFLKATFIGAASAAASFGIGELTSTIPNLATKIGAQAVLHGFSQGIVAGVQGGDFMTGFVSGSLSSLASSFWSGGDNITDNGNYTMSRTVYGGAGSLGRSTVGMISFGTVMGGAGAYLTGGNFWQGAVTGLIVSGLNHAAHAMMQPKTTVAGIYGAGGENASGNPALKELVEGQGGKMFTSSVGGGDDEIIAYLKAGFEKGNQLKLYGHSRGAAAAVRIANKLGAMHINISEMTLYDPVGMYFGGSFNFDYPNVMKVTNYYQRNPVDGLLFWADNPFQGSPVSGSFQWPAINNINLTGEYYNGALINHINITRYAIKNP